MPSRSTLGEGHVDIAALELIDVELLGVVAHDALDALAVGIAKRKVNYILDADIRSFFDLSAGNGWSGL